MLTDREQTYYAELFQSCDVDGTGKFLGQKVSELFRSTGLPQDILYQVTELCGAKRLGHFGRSQFYIALKLIAAAQCGLPVSHDSINSGKDIPLPAFQRLQQNDQGSIPQFQLPNVALNTDNLGPNERHQGQLLPPPSSAKKSHARNLSGQYRGGADPAPLQVLPQQAPAKDSQQTDIRSPTFPPSQAHPLSQIPPPSSLSPPTSPQVTAQGPRFTSPTSPSSSIPPGTQTAPQGATHPIPHTGYTAAPDTQVVGGLPLTGQATMPGGQVNVVAAHVGVQPGGQGQPSMVQSAGSLQANTMSEREWEIFASDDERHGLVTGQQTDWDDKNLKIPEFDSSSYSSDPESVDDVWNINDEQRDYYIKQFQGIEPDINGHISGHVAKDFFEKSKLSNQELSKIWQLSDINKDGALSLEEFCIAMHLVVLRRNEIEIPDKLPFALMPYNALTNEEPFAADLPQGSTIKRPSPTVSPTTAAAQWESVLLQESPQVSSSEVSSPGGGTPANFDFQQPESDTEAHIVHPKARRLSPETVSDIPDGRPERGRAFSDPAPSSDGPLHDSELSHTPLTKQRSNTTSHADHNQIDATSAALHGRPRPSVKKTTVPVIPGHIMPPAPTTSQSVVESGDRPFQNAGGSVDSGEPPIPPPRPGQHERSFSVDYKAPPAVPPRVADKDAPAPSVMKGEKFAQFKRFEPIQSQEALNIVAGAETVLTNGTDLERHRRTQSLDTRQTDGGFGELEGDTAGDPKVSAVAWDLLGPDFVDGSAERQAEFEMAAQRQANRDKKELQMAIRTHKERNSTLSRLNSELNQELQEVMEQRIALEIQLEHLRPFSS